MGLKWAPNVPTPALGTGPEAADPVRVISPHTALSSLSYRTVPRWGMCDRARSRGVIYYIVFWRPQDSTTYTCTYIIISLCAVA